VQVAKFDQMGSAFGGYLQQFSILHEEVCGGVEVEQGESLTTLVTIQANRLGLKSLFISPVEFSKTGELSTSQNPGIVSVGAADAIENSPDG